MLRRCTFSDSNTVQGRLTLLHGPATWAKMTVIFVERTGASVFARVRLLASEPVVLILSRLLGAVLEQELPHLRHGLTGMLCSVPALFGFVLFLGGVRCIVGASDSFRSTCMLAFDFVSSLVADLSVMLKRCYLFIRFSL